MEVTSCLWGLEETVSKIIEEIICASLEKVRNVIGRWRKGDYCHMSFAVTLKMKNTHNKMGD